MRYGQTYDLSITPLHHGNKTQYCNASPPLFPQKTRSCQTKLNHYMGQIAMQSYLCDVQFCAKIELHFATTVPFLMLFRGQGSSKATTQGDKILTKATTFASRAKFQQILSHWGNRVTQLLLIALLLFNYKLAHCVIATEI